jgi:hypothetical protein
MKKIIVLLVLVMLVTSTSGCGIFRRMRDRLCRGAFCGSTAAPATVAPAPSPIFVPQAAMPMAHPGFSMPCETCYPCDPCADPCATHMGSFGSNCDCNSSGYLPSGTFMEGSPQPAAPSTFLPGPRE